MSLNTMKNRLPPLPLSSPKSKKIKLPGLRPARGRLATGQHCALSRAWDAGAGFFTSEEVSIARAVIYGHARMDARLQGRRAFGELSRAVVERHLPAAGRSGTSRRGGL